MPDPRIEKLANLLVNYSLRLQPGDLFLIKGVDFAAPLIREVYKKALLIGAHPYTRISIDGLEEILFKHASDEQLQFVSPLQKQEIETINATLSVWAGYNTKSLTNVDPKKQALADKANQPILDRFLERAAKGELRWCGTAFPNHAAAQDAEMSLSEYEDFVYGAMWMDEDDPIAEWQKFSAEQQRLTDALNKVKTLSVVGPDTDLTMSFEGRTWINCDGHENFPDGEIFSAPVEDSVNGHVTFSFPAVVSGREVDGIRLWFENGRVVKEEATRGFDFLRDMLNMDGGARVVGEFAIGNNYGITRYTKDTLFDEKIGGTVHIALGASYPESGGKNTSALHWDIVCDLRGGGQVIADGAVIQENGRWRI